MRMKVPFYLFFAFVVSSTGCGSGGSSPSDPQVKSAQQSRELIDDHVLIAPGHSAVTLFPLENDELGSLASVRIELITSPTAGKARIEPGQPPSLRYQITASDWHQDQFRYAVFAGEQRVGQANIYLQRDTAAQPLRAKDDQLTLVRPDTVASVQPFLNDTLPEGTRLHALSAPRYGTFAGQVEVGDVIDAQSTFNYEPSPGFAGADRVQYTLIGESGQRSDASITLRVEDPQPRPVASSDARVLRPPADVLLAVLDNDRFDVPGAILSALAIETPAQLGQVSVDTGVDPLDPRDDRIRYQVSAGIRGTDQFQYRLTDEDGDFTVTDVFIILTNDANAQRYSVSGEIRIQSGSQVDLTTNQSSTGAKNNHFEQAQLLRNPVTLGGYLNEAGLGAAGASFQQGDLSDVYRVDLRKDQVIRTHSAMGPQHDLDLYLFPASCTDTSCQLSNCDPQRASGDVQRALSLGAVESLTVAQSGEYLLEVCLNQGASNYTLTIADFTPLQASLYTLEQEFVPDEILVRYAPGAGLMASTPLPAGLTSVPHKQPHLQRVRLNQWQPPSHPKQRYFHALSGEHASKYNTLYALSTLQSRPDIRYAEPNYRRYPLRIPNDPLYPLQWHYSMLGLPDAWEITTGSSDVTVAVIDTGIRSDHEDFAASDIIGYDFISDPFMSLDGDGLDPDPFDPGDGLGLLPDSYHGTHVAGTIAANTDNQIGVAGTSWETQLMHLRVLGLFGSGTDYDIAQALLYAGGLPNDSGTLPSRPADIINLSLGGTQYSASTQDVINQLAEKGILVVAAAGNSGTEQTYYPAGYEHVISVGAVGPDAVHTAYSSFGAHLDVAAPGGDTQTDTDADGYPDGVLSTLWDTPSSLSVYRHYEGTSMAAPHVSGVLALMKAIHPSMQPDQFDAWLSLGALSQDLGESGHDPYYGHGLIQAERAVRQAQGASDLPPALAVSPGRLNFGAERRTLSVTARNQGGGQLGQLTVTSPAPWLSIDTQHVRSNGQGRYLIHVDRAALDAGAYESELVIHTDSEQISLPVTLQVIPPALQNNTGAMRVMLIDPELNVVVRQSPARFDSGRYHFAIDQVPPGEYFLMASSDLDNDQMLCDAGEACAVYPNAFASKETLKVHADVHQLEMTSAFEINLSSP